MEPDKQANDQPPSEVLKLPQKSSKETWIETFRQRCEEILVRPTSSALSPSPLIKNGVPIYPPPCEFLSCDAHYRTTSQQEDSENTSLRYSRAITDEEATKILQSYVQEINDSRGYLKRCIETHGNVIINRWRKKSTQQRADMLAQALPSLIRHKKPRVFYVGPRNPRERPGSLVCYLNIQELKEDPAKLLRLLHIRTGYPPETFTRFDEAQHEPFWRIGKLKILYNLKCVVMYGTSYGSLTSWDFTMSHQRTILGFPRAQLVIEAHKVVMVFLRNMVEQMMRGVSLASPSGNSKWTKSLAFGMKGIRASGSWAKFTNPAYHSPPVMDFKDFTRLTKLAKTRLAAAEDELWLLQTDAAYVQLLFNSRLNDRYRRPDVAINYHLAYGALASLVIEKAFFRFQGWRWIAFECERMNKDYDEHQDMITSGQDSELDLNDSIAALYWFLVVFVEYEGQLLAFLLSISPSFQEHYNFDSANNRTLKYMPFGQNNPKGKIKPSNETIMLPPSVFWNKDPLFSCLYFICQYGMALSVSHMFQSDLFGILELHVASNPQEFDRITTDIDECLSTLAPLHELIYTLNYLPPHPATYGRIGVPTLCARTGVRWWKALNGGGVRDRESLTTMGEKLRKFLSVKLPRRKRDPTWLEEMAIVRESLGELWDETRRCIRDKFAATEEQVLDEEEIESAMDILKFNRTSAYLEMLQAERESILNPKPRMRPILAEYKVPSQIEWKNQESSHVGIKNPRIKVKSRPTTQQPDEVSAEHLQLSISDDDESSDQPSGKLEEVDEQISTIAVKPESRKLLQQMFPCPTSNDDAKHFRWPQVVLAFEDAGFTVTHSGGSGYTFSSPNGDGAICFHRPHPDNKVNPILLHGMGKRMNKWFGWCRETFVERVKK